MSRGDASCIVGMVGLRRLHSDGETRQCGMLTASACQCINLEDAFVESRAVQHLK